MNELLAYSKSPGKLILSGEHSTVYGKKSVAITVDLYTECKIYETNNGTVYLNLGILNYEKIWPYEILKNFSKLINKIEDFHFNEEESLKKINDFWQELKSEPTNIMNSCLVFLFLYLSIGDLSERKSIRVYIKSQLPNGAGLGSSSAYIVSLARTLFDAFKVSIDKKEFNRWCWEMDKLFHGKPSGVDNTICTYGGAILFQKGQIIEQIDPLDLPELKVLLVNTMVPRNTKIMVEKCRQRITLFNDIGDKLLELLDYISQKVWFTLKNNPLNIDRLSTLFEMNQHLLNCINVGHEKISEIVNIAKQYEFSAKLTGAGGGGIVMIYLNDDKNLDSLIGQLHSKGYETYQVKLGVPGVFKITQRFF